MLQFHTNIFARPSQVAQGPTIELRGIELATIAGLGSGPPVFDRPLPVSFEAIGQALLLIPRMDIEPDGYFLVAGGECENERWQVDGHLFEHDGQMHRVEMHGTCNEDTLSQLLKCLGNSGCEHVFQLVHEGVTLRYPEFLRWASRPPG